MESVVETLAKVTLSTGFHFTRGEGMCVMECVAFVAGEPHSDRPACACPVISKVAIYANDRYLPEIGPELARRVLLLAGSVADHPITQERIYAVLDFVFRHALVSGPVHSYVKSFFAALPPIVGAEQLSDISRLADQLHNAGEAGLLYLRPVREILTSMRLSAPDCAAFSAMRLLSLGNTEFDALALLDQLLAIGATKPVTPTQGMRRRVDELVDEANGLAICE